MTRRPVPALVTLLGATVLLVAVAPIAVGHEGSGVLDVESVEPSPAGPSVTVRLTWSDDRHPAADATVTVTAVDGAGAALTPVPLDPIDDDGRYAADVPLPDAGTWTLRVTSITPTASVEEPYVQEATTTTAPTTPTTTVETTTSTERSATIVAAAGDDSGADGDGSFAIPLLVAAALVVTGVVGAMVLRSRGRA